MRANRRGPYISRWKWVGHGQPVGYTTTDGVDRLIVAYPSSSVGRGQTSAWRQFRAGHQEEMVPKLIPCRHARTTAAPSPYITEGWCSGAVAKEPLRKSEIMAGGGPWTTTTTTTVHGGGRRAGNLQQEARTLQGGRSCPAHHGWDGWGRGAMGVREGGPMRDPGRRPGI